MNLSWDERPADVQLLLDSGLLFEINRATLHLVGLALTVRKDDAGKLYLAIKDNRKNPELAVYNEENFVLGKAKKSKFMKEFGTEQINKRIEKLGWAFQPEPLRGE